MRRGAMLKVWKIKASEHKHEQEDASMLIEALRVVLSPLSETFHLLLSPRINGCAFDVLLVSSGGFCIFEMKHVRVNDYVIATENRWTKGPRNGNREVMRGGSEYDNGPFEQVGRYRNALANFLRDNTTGVLNVGTPMKKYKHLIRGCVVIFPAHNTGINDKNKINNAPWFSMCRISSLQEHARTSLIPDRAFFSDDDLEDLIQKCFGFSTKDCTFNKERNMNNLSNEDFFEQNKRKNQEKKDSKANARARKLEKENAELKAELKQKDKQAGNGSTESSNPLDFILNPQNHPEILKLLQEKVFIGIDFGTSNTTVTMLHYDTEKKCLRADPFKIKQSDTCDDTDALQSHIVPTAIAYSKKDGLIFGKGAKERLTATKKFRQGCNVWTEFKMNVGTSMVYQQTMLTSNNREANNGIVIETPEDATREFFKFLKKQIDAKAAELNKKADYLITVPASFALNQRTGLRNAVISAGIDLKPYSFLDEPNGAFIGVIAYYITENRTAAKDAFLRMKNFLVFDFGAGTCDISILSLIGDTLLIKNRAVSRFTALGGRNIDHKIVTDILIPQIQAENPNIPKSYYSSDTNGLCRALSVTAEKLKCAICSEYETTKRVKEQPFFFSDKPENLEISLKTPYLNREAFKKVMEIFTSKDDKLKQQSIFAPIEEALKKAELKKNDIDAIILVGGSAKNPCIKSSLEQYFSSSTNVIECGDICSLVSRGAAIASFYANGLKQPVITPILSEGIFMKAIERDNVLVIPREEKLPIAKREFDGGTLRLEAGEGLFEIPLYAGDESRPLGTVLFELQGGDASVNDEVHFSYEMTTDKVLHYWIKVNKREFTGRLEYPLVSEKMSKEQLRRAEAKRKLENATLQNNGKPPREILEETAQILMKEDFDEDAADCYRDIKRFYPTENNVNETELKRAECYRKMSKHELEFEAVESSHKLKPTDSSYWYRIWAASRAYGWSSNVTKQCLQEALDAYQTDNDLHYVKMVQLRETGERDDAQRIAKKLYDEWSEEIDSLDEYTLVRFREVALYLGENEMVNKLNVKISRKSRQNTATKKPEVDKVPMYLRFEEYDKC